MNVTLERLRNITQQTRKQQLKLLQIEISKATTHQILHFQLLLQLYGSQYTIAYNQLVLLLISRKLDFDSYRAIKKNRLSSIIKFIYYYQNLWMEALLVIIGTILTIFSSINILKNYQQQKTTYLPNNTIIQSVEKSYQSNLSYQAIYIIVVFLVVWSIFFLLAYGSCIFDGFITKKMQILQQQKKQLMKKLM